MTSMPKAVNVEVIGAGVAAIGASLFASFYFYRKNKILQNRINELVADEDDSKQDGVDSRFRTDSNVFSGSMSYENDDGGESDNEMVFKMKEIGIITSPYPQRAGTPRQGLLAPHSRSHLTLHSFIPKETLDDLDQYSHVWIIFQFHLNPIGKGKDSKAKRESTLQNRANAKKGGHQFGFTSSKIKPPRAGGKKVGVLATRSPHRPNNVGLSLARVEGVSTIEVEGYSGSYKRKKKTILKLLGLDLVDGTPVYDIKPYLPSDRVGDVIFESGDMDNINKSRTIDDDDIMVPHWVSEDDKLSSISWSTEARETVHVQRENGALYPLYPPLEISQRSNWIDDEVCLAISEIVAQDPRAQRDKRGDITEDNKMYEITFCSLRVGFTVNKMIKMDHKEGLDDNSTMKDDEKYHALIVDIWPDPGDITAIEGSYQHNLAIRRREEQKAAKVGKVLKWTNPVREGVTKGLCDHILEYHQSFSSSKEDEIESNEE